MTTHKRGVYTRDPLAGRGRGGEGVAFPLFSPGSPPWGEKQGGESVEEKRERELQGRQKEDERAQKIKSIDK